MIYMNHIIDEFVKLLPNDVERKKFADGLESDNSIVDFIPALIRTLDADFVNAGRFEMNALELSNRRVAYVAVVSFLESIQTAQKQFSVGLHPSQKVDSGGGVSG